MKRLFPDMRNQPTGGIWFGALACWPIAFVVFPFLVSPFSTGLADNPQTVAWLECIYQAVCGGLLAFLMKEYLADAWIDVQIDLKQHLKTAGVTLTLMVLWMAVCWELAAGLFDTPFALLDAFPLAAMPVVQTDGYMVTSLPIPGLLCMTLLAPFAICGLFYVGAFAPICYRKPWLAYPLTAVALVVPVLFDLFWRGGYFGIWFDYFARLPIHLLACWSYQKTDGPWVPIATLVVFNLFCSIVCVMISALPI